MYIALFLTLKALYIVRGGGSPHLPPVCSIHLDDTTAAIMLQNTPHTPTTGGEETVMKPIKRMRSPHTSYRWRGDRDEDNQCMHPPHTSYRWRGDRDEANQAYAPPTHQLQVERRP